MYSGNSATNLNKIDGNTRLHNHRSMNGINRIDDQDQESNVMSMKKSAEIAATFSGAKINQMTDIVDPDLSSEQEEAKAELEQFHNGGGHHRGGHHSKYNQHQFSESNMHSSLGYFPWIVQFHRKLLKLWY